MTTVARGIGAIAPLVVVALLMPASAPAASGPRCRGLKGTNLAKGSLAKVVDHSNRRGARTVHHYFVCPRPMGLSKRAKELRASRAGGALSFLDANGGNAVVRDAANRRVFVFDLRTRRRHRLTVGGINPRGKVVVGQAGEAATIVSGRVIGFDFDGRSAVLDAGPAAISLSRRRDTVSWKTGATSRQADLARPQVPCAKQGGKVVAQRDGVRVTSFNYSGEYFTGHLDGIVDRTRACLLGADGSTVLNESAFPTTGALGGSFYFLESVAAPFVVGVDSSEDSESTVYQTVKLADLRTGQTARAFDLGGGYSEPYLDSAVFVTPAGTVALATNTETEDSENNIRILARRVDGSVRELDRGPKSQFGRTGGDDDKVKLTLMGTTLSWTRGGQTKSADLAG